MSSQSTSPPPTKSVDQIFVRNGKPMKFKLVPCADREKVGRILSQGGGVLVDNGKPIDADVIHLAPRGVSRVKKRSVALHFVFESWEKREALDVSRFILVPGGGPLLEAPVGETDTSTPRHLSVADVFPDVTPAVTPFLASLASTEAENSAFQTPPERPKSAMDEPVLNSPVEEDIDVVGFTQILPVEEEEEEDKNEEVSSPEDVAPGSEGLSEEDERMDASNASSSKSFGIAVEKEEKSRKADGLGLMDKDSVESQRPPKKTVKLIYHGGDKELRDHADTEEDASGVVGKVNDRRASSEPDIAEIVTESVPESMPDTEPEPKQARTIAEVVHELSIFYGITPAAATLAMKESKFNVKGAIHRIVTEKTVSAISDHDLINNQNHKFKF